MARIKISRILIAAAVLTIAAATAGCGEDTGESLVKEEATADPGEEAGCEDGSFDPAYEFDDLTDEMLDAVPDLETLTEEELAGMSIDELRAFVAVWSPEYRTVYGIGDKEMTDSDWESLRCLMSYRLFGELFPSSAEESMLVSEDSLLEGDEAGYGYYSIEDTGPEDEEITDEEIDESVAFLESLSDEDFAAVVEGLYQELYGEELGLAGLTDEELQEFRESIITGLEEEKGKN